MTEHTFNSHITGTLQNTPTRGQKGLIPYIMAGDPDLDTTVELAVAMAEAGADVLELGVPFSDPVADGPTIQAAGQRALAAGAKLPGILEAVRQIRRRSHIPLVLMTYYNPVYRYGPEKFVLDAVAAGAGGMIVPDLPPEESDLLLRAADNHGLDLIPLITPNTPTRRLKIIAGRARGFVYCVSVTGVTGERRQIAANLSAFTAAVREHTVLPVAVGFGISRPEQAAQTAQYCDAVVVGSALVKTVAERGNTPDLVPSVARQVGELKKALAGREVKQVVTAL
ncbi:MAG: tryptophan synthase subunit alpha [Firmicutes bacterium]|nr:tryptophan synthase subunit alpha [Bacillota bacterium]